LAQYIRRYLYQRYQLFSSLYTNFNQRYLDFREIKSEPSNFNGLLADFKCFLLDHEWRVESLSDLWLPIPDFKQVCCVVDFLAKKLLSFKAIYIKDEQLIGITHFQERDVAIKERYSLQPFKSEAGKIQGIYLFTHFSIEELKDISQRFCGIRDPLLKAIEEFHFSFTSFELQSLSLWRECFRDDTVLSLINAVDTKNIQFLPEINKSLIEFLTRKKEEPDQIDDFPENSEAGISDSSLSSPPESLSEIFSSLSEGVQNDSESTLHREIPQETETDVANFD